MSNWSKLLALSAREKSLLAQSLIALPINALALYLMGLNRWQRILARLARVPTGAQMNESRMTRVRQVERMVCVAASRGLYRGNCLQQSLTLWWLLRRQKIESDIRFGARRESGKFEAHAWVELDGIALNDGADIHRSFTPFEHSMIRVDVNTR